MPTLKPRLRVASSLNQIDSKNCCRLEQQVPDFLGADTLPENGMNNNLVNLGREVSSPPNGARKRREPAVKVIHPRADRLVVSEHKLVIQNSLR
ncbi:hypothetical protein NW767_012895 [Fusarium falciforme]|nr:hypothetical protein NW767_012895 [Fusarium falciforme]